ncbi:hypothetical protein ADEAN_000733900 [Angomonas deanei]|uniref:Uncharacterized protein n=1 Tax=Angomonas deanei TaxID=59799 RepID=A0A7G2CJ71_9TRYP|nr:hypothetical protein ADEAN_000733900 [Angomonas deanei]
MQSISRKNRSQLLRRILLGAVVLLLVLMLLRFFSWDSEDLAAPLSPPAKPLRNSVYDEAAIRKKVVPLAPALLCAKTVVGKDEAGKDMQALLTTVKGERPDTLARVCEASA